MAAGLGQGAVDVGKESMEAQKAAKILSLKNYYEDQRQQAGFAHDVTMRQGQEAFETRLQQAGFEHSDTQLDRELQSRGAIEHAKAQLQIDLANAKNASDRARSYINYRRTVDAANALAGRSPANRRFQRGSVKVAPLNSDGTPDISKEKVTVGGVWDSHHNITWVTDPTTGISRQLDPSTGGYVPIGPAPGTLTTGANRRPGPNDAPGKVPGVSDDEFKQLSDYVLNHPEDSDRVDDYASKYHQLPAGFDFNRAEPSGQPPSHFTPAPMDPSIAAALAGVMGGSDGGDSGGDSGGGGN
jgi:hypothetical protein